MECIFEIILKANTKEKNDQYWKKILKIFDFIDILLYYKEEVIDINQRLISTELFEHKAFDRLFL